MNVGTIAGGTRAGWRRVKPPHPKWGCKCFVSRPGLTRDPRPKENPGWRGSCDDCGAKRPT